MSKDELIAEMSKLGAVLDEANRNGKPVSSDIIAEYESIVQSMAPCLARCALPSSGSARHKDLGSLTGRYQ